MRSSTRTLTLSFAVGVHSASAAAGSTTVATPPPEAVQVEVVVGDGPFVLGDQIELELVVHNVGDAPFAVAWGRDFGAGGRPERYLVRAVHADGDVALDPLPRVGLDTGPGGEAEVGVGGASRDRVLLHRHALIERAGTWQVEVSHDLGWTRRSTAEVTVSVRLPTEAEASGQVSAEASAQEPDFSRFHLPQHLPALVALASAGDARALDGLQASLHVDATRALLDLAERPGPLRREALQALVARRPGLWDSHWPSGEALATRSWSEPLFPLARRVALEALGAEDGSDVVGGAWLLASVGHHKDAGDFVRALERIVARSDAAHSGAHEQLLGALDEAGDRLLAHGARLPHLPTTDGAALWLALELRSASLPTRRALVAHPSPTVRWAALRELRDDDAAALAREVRLAIEQGPLWIQLAALDAAALARHPLLAEAALDQLDRSLHPEVLRRALAVAALHESSDRAYATLARRLDDPAATRAAFALLTQLARGGLAVPGPGATDWEAFRNGPQPALWRALVADHANALRAGEGLQLGEAPLTEAVFPDGYRIERAP